MDSSLNSQGLPVTGSTNEQRHDASSWRKERTDDLKSFSKDNQDLFKFELNDRNLKKECLLKVSYRIF